MVEFHPKDILQVIIGAAILAIPVGFTEETWHLGEILPIGNVMGFVFFSFLFLSIFAYYTYYRNRMKQHWGDFVKRVIFTYALSFIIVSLLLTLIQVAPWTTNTLVAFKRIILVTFPASMSAAVADTIK